MARRFTEFRYHRDPETGLPHIYDHGITESEVEQVLHGHGDDVPADSGARMKIGQTGAGRYLQVIYSPDDDGIGVFVITAFELKGKSKKAFRRRQRRKRQ
jgi:hypothetical protein